MVERFQKEHTRLGWVYIGIGLKAERDGCDGFEANSHVSSETDSSREEHGEHAKTRHTDSITRHNPLRFAGPDPWDREPVP
jgi:phosphoribosylformylglycinamidine (FGAM) synthase-like enzyme